MLFKYVALLTGFGVLAAAPALTHPRRVADVASPPHAGEEGEAVLPRHGPRVVLPGTRPDVYDPVRHATDSYNTTWAGYAVTGSDFTHVAGSWIVSAVDCTVSPKSFSSEWVGIDGWKSNTVEQIGTDADCRGDNPSYYVWYEFFPNGTKVIKDVSIAAGDVFTAEVTYEGENQFKVSITNRTTGESFAKTETFTTSGGETPKLSSAEWIEERDGGKLADFGTDSFGPFYTTLKRGEDVATNSTVTDGAIGAFPDVFASFATVTGTSSGADSAVPSALAADEGSFTVTWDSE